MGLRKLAWDAAKLAVAAVVMRCIGLAYQVWLAGRIGPAGVGLWQLVMSVNVFSATVAISGIRFTTTRLVAEEAGAGKAAGVGYAVGRCLVYAAFFGAAAFLILFFGAEPIGFLWVRDARTVDSLKILSLSLPMLSLSCVFNGYFIATGRSGRSAAVQVIEQLAGIGAVMLLLDGVGENDLAGCCAAIARGSVTADGVSLALIAGLYALDRRRRGRGGASPRLTGRLLRIALPLAVSAYARTGLSTLENLLVPRKLRAAGYSSHQALSGYGTITGMVFPILSFPSCLLSAVAELTVPELTAAQVAGDEARISETVSRLLRWALGFALCAGAFLFVCADPLGMLIYHDPAVGPYLRVLSALVPFMYVDIVADGCLKGLGQMLWSMAFNIAEAACGVLLVVTVLPRRALQGYLFVLFFCEIFNFTLSLWRLRRVSGFRLLPGRKTVQKRKWQYD